MLIRLIFIALLITLVYLLLRRRGRKRQQSDRELGRFVRCAQCDLHLPTEQALREGSHWFCGELHRDQYRATKQPKS